MTAASTVGVAVGVAPDLTQALTLVRLLMARLAPLNLLRRPEPVL